MNTKLKGDIGELIVAQELLSRGWHVAFPFGENLKYDLIAEKKGICKRIQVKSVSPKDNVLHVNCRSSNNWSVIHYTKEDFEVLAAVDLETHEVYFIPSSKIGRNMINLRLSKSKNGQTRKINFADKFLEIE